MAFPILIASENEITMPAQDEPLYEIVKGQRVDLQPMSAYLLRGSLRVYRVDCDLI